MTVTLLRGNALALPIAGGTVDLIVTSPPYFGLRSYTDAGAHYTGQIGSENTPTEFVAALIAATAEMIRVLKPTGSIWVNLGDKYATYAGNRSAGRSSLQGATDRSRPAVPRLHGLDGGGEIQAKSLMGIPWRYALRCIDDLGLILRAEVIWSKPNGLPESVTDRVRRSHEQWFHFTLHQRYYSAVDQVREPYQPETAGRYANGYRATKVTTAGQPQNPTGRADAGGPAAVNALGKLPGSVWTVPTQPLTVPADIGIDHFAAFPMEWPRRIIRGWCPPAGVVLDPFGGTGTVALVADVLGRHGISVDMSGDYCRLAAWRTADPGQRANAAGVERPAAQAAGQMDLFGGLLGLLDGEETA